MTLKPTGALLFPGRQQRGRRSEPDARADEKRERPARTVAVNISQAFLDEPVHVRQASQVTDLRLGHHLDGTDTNEEAGSRPQTDRPRLLEELAILRCQSRRDIGGYIDERP